MSRIVGVIYPNSFQPEGVIGAVQKLFKTDLHFHHFSYQNLEMGTWTSQEAETQSYTKNSAKKTPWVFIDGRLHNAAKLREELREELGYRFYTETDEEVIIHAYEAWKEECLHKFDGPFALAVFDKENEVLLLARDHLGQKPFYWTCQGNYWLFSTHLKSLLATGIVPQSPSYEAIGAYLHFGFVPQDLSIIHHVNKLLPGYYLKINLERQILIEQFWSYSEHLEAKHSLPLDEAYQKLHAHLNEAVSVTSAGKIGSALTGNLGSSVLLWNLKECVPIERLQACTAIFDEPQPLELETSSALAHSLSISHLSKHIMPAEVQQVLPEIVWHLEEPLADPCMLQTWYAAKLGAPDAVSMVSDTGWEEMFGTTREICFERRPFSFFLARSPAPFRDAFLIPLLNLLGLKIKYRILLELESPYSYMCPYQPLFMERERKKVSRYLYSAFNPEIFSQRFHKLKSIGGTVAPALYYAAKTQLPDSKLFQYDRLCSAHGLEVLHPYLNGRLVEFLASLPDRVKFKAEESAAFLQGFATHEYSHFPQLPKRAGSFLDTWCHNTEFRGIFAQLAKGRLANEGLISGKWIRQELGYPYLVPTNFKQLWALLILEIWFRLFIDQPITDSPPTLSVQELLRTK